jgi:excisionase family DNA binding protein
MSNRVYLTSEKAAKYLGITDQTLFRFREEGTGPAFYLIGRTYKYTVDDLEKYLESRRIEGPFRKPKQCRRAAASATEAA